MAGAAGHVTGASGGAGGRGAAAGIAAGASAAAAEGSRSLGPAAVPVTAGCLPKNESNFGSFAILSASSFFCFLF